MKMIRRLLWMNGQIVKENVKACRAQQSVERFQRKIFHDLSEVAPEIFGDLLPDADNPIMLRKMLRVMLNRRSRAIAMEYISKLKVRKMFRYWKGVTTCS